MRKLVADLAGWTDPAVIQLTPEARDLLLGVEKAIEPKLARDGEYGAVREWASKLVGAIVRIAGLLHLATETETFRTPISVGTVGDAIRFGGYFAEHAQAVVGLLGDSGTSDAAYLLEFLHRRGIEEFTIRSLLTDLPRGRFAGTDEVSVAVELLTEHGWVIPLPAPERTGPGRKPSPGYRTHPAVATFTPADMAAESAQSAESPYSTNSADTADSAATSTTEEQPCRECGQELLLHEPGRTVCERCRLNGVA